MSLDKLRTGEKPSRCLTGEGRREGTGQQPASPQRSGGVGVEGTFGSSVRESWESSGGGRGAQPRAQAGQTCEAGGAVGAVGVPRSSGDGLVTEPGAKGGHLLNALRRSKGHGDGRGNPDNNPGLSSGASNRALPERQRRANVLGWLAAGQVNGLGEPNMGKPSVRFDEGRESVGHWPTGLSIHPLLPTLPV